MTLGFPQTILLHESIKLYIHKLKIVSHALDLLRVATSPTDSYNVSIWMMRMTSEPKSHGLQLECTFAACLKWIMFHHHHTFGFYDTISTAKLETCNTGPFISYSLLYYHVLMLMSTYVSLWVTKRSLKQNTDVLKNAWMSRSCWSRFSGED